jgi:hypothetical protein
MTVRLLSPALLLLGLLGVGGCGQDPPPTPANELTPEQEKQINERLQKAREAEGARPNR